MTKRLSKLYYYNNPKLVVSHNEAVRFLSHRVSTLEIVTPCKYERSWWAPPHTRSCSYTSPSSPGHHPGCTPTSENPVKRQSLPASSLSTSPCCNHHYRGAASDCAPHATDLHRERCARSQRRAARPRRYLWPPGSSRRRRGRGGPAGAMTRRRRRMHGDLRTGRPPGQDPRP